jgi:hypothetical protein
MDSKFVTQIPTNKMANIALRVSIFNIICWLLIAIPNFLLSPWSSFELVTIPLSAMIALVAGIIGMLRLRVYGAGHWQSLIGITIGVLNIVMIWLSLVGISAMVNCC